MIFKLYRFKGTLKTSMHNLLEAITTPSNKLSSLIKERENIPEFKQQANALKDLESIAVLKLHELDNNQLLQLLETYSSAGEGTQKLYKSIGYQISKRLHSFSNEELSEFAYYLVPANSVTRIFSILEHKIMADVFSLSEESAGKLCYSYSVHGLGSTQFWESLKQIFLVSWDNFDIASGLLFVTGISKRQVSLDIVKTIENWARKHMNEMAKTELVQCVFCLVKLNGENSLIENVECLISIAELTLRDIEKLLGVYHSRNRNSEITEKLLNRSIELLVTGSPFPHETTNYIYTITNYNVPNLQKSLENYIRTKESEIEPDEMVNMFKAIIITKQETPAILEIYEKRFKGGINPNLIPQILVPFLQRETVPTWLYSLIPNILVHIKGKIYAPSQYSLILCSLLQLGYENAQFYQEAAREAQFISISNSEEYMEVYMTIRQIQRKGVEVGEILEYLERTYESKQ